MDRREAVLHSELPLQKQAHFILILMRQQLHLVEVPVNKCKHKHLSTNYHVHVSDHIMIMTVFNPTKSRPNKDMTFQSKKSLRAYDCAMFTDVCISGTIQHRNAALFTHASLPQQVHSFVTESVACVSLLMQKTKSMDGELKHMPHIPILMKKDKQNNSYWNPSHDLIMVLGGSIRSHNQRAEIFLLEQKNVEYALHPGVMWYTIYPILASRLLLQFRYSLLSH